MKRWRVEKHGGRWRVLDAGAWMDTFPTLPEAHTYATQLAVVNEIFEPGGLSFLKELQTAYVTLHTIRATEGVPSQ